MKHGATVAGGAAHAARLHLARAGCMIMACMALTGCPGGASVMITTSVPRPLVEVMPVKMGVYYDQIITNYIHREELDGHGYFEIDVGASQVPTLERVFDAMFQRAIPVADQIAHIVPPPPASITMTDDERAAKKLAEKKAERQAINARKKAEKAKRQAHKQAEKEAKRKDRRTAKKKDDDGEDATDEPVESEVAQSGEESTESLDDDAQVQQTQQQAAAVPEPAPIDAVEIMAELKRQAIDIDALLVPQIRDFQFTLPQQTRTDIYEVWLRYRLLLYAPDGSEIAQWEVYGYGKTDRRNYPQRPNALTDATIWALRDAAAYISFYFPEAPGIKEWFAARAPEPE